MEKCGLLEWHSRNLKAGSWGAQALRERVERWAPSPGDLNTASSQVSGLSSLDPWFSSEKALVMLPACPVYQNDTTSPEVLFVLNIFISIHSNNWITQKLGVVLGSFCSSQSPNKCRFPIYIQKFKIWFLHLHNFTVAGAMTISHLTTSTDS